MWHIPHVGLVEWDGAEFRGAAMSLSSLIESGRLTSLKDWLAGFGALCDAFFREIVKAAPRKSERRRFKMARLKTVRVRNFRSIGDWVEISMPKRGPLVLLGENNAGKSNVIRALDLVLGETWPGNFHPEDHDFHDRDRDCIPMKINLDVEGVWHESRYNSMAISQLLWHYDPEDEERECGLNVCDENGATAWASGATRSQITCVVIGADRRLQYQLGYSSKWTMLARLMRKFHEKLISDEERVERLHHSFDEIVSIFREVEEFESFDRQLREMASSFAANLRYGLDLDFSAYDPSNYYRSLGVHPTSNGEVRSFDELGTGQEQILAVAFAYAYARAYSAGDEGLVMVIEEPEAHLHPIAQQWLGRKISELHGDGVQVIVTTHSPAFVDLGNPGSLVCVRKSGVPSSTTVVQHSRPALAQILRESGASKATAGTIGPFYSASATTEHVTGLFARACVVVEGQTEVLALPELLNATGTDVLELGIAIVSAEGIGAIARWLRLYWAYQVPAMALFDRDSRDDPHGTRRDELLRTLGVTQGDYLKELSEGQPLFVCDAYAVFTTDFESAMRGMFAEYASLEDQARQVLGTPKPLVAREACRLLRDDMTSAGWTDIEALGSAIQKLVQPPD
jgi:putative ATP-dependent endonuclease of OLD family